MSVKSQACAGSATSWRGGMCRCVALAIMLSAAPALAPDAAAQEDLPQSEVAALPHVPGPRACKRERRTSASAMGPARDFRVLWADPSVRNFVGVSENGWDFNRPESIPGFGTLPEPHPGR